MANIYPIYRGDVVPFEFTLMRNEVPHVIDAGATVVAGLRVGNVLIGGPYVCDSAAPGADWGEGIVCFEISSEQTAQLPLKTNVQVEIRVVDSGKPLTWLSDPVASIEISSLLTA